MGELDGLRFEHVPAGNFPACHSPLDVYDLNGNAAEHMNLPLNDSQMSSRGSQELGYTEMKGSWFVFDTYRAHDDWCRWRAPFWHGSRVMDEHSHANYHLGFRCVRTSDEAPPARRAMTQVSAARRPAPCLIVSRTCEDSGSAPHR